MRIGVDVVAVERLAGLLAQHAQAAGSLFTAREQRYCRGRRRSGEHFAARFAAKEAVLKAFGTGLSNGLRWTDIEVVKEPGGRPVIELHGAARALALRSGLRQLEVSLSHSGGFALAHALVVMDRDRCAST
jgi:holo-[acyl-carrier protein] synthase